MLFGSQKFIGSQDDSIILEDLVNYSTFIHRFQSVIFMKAIGIWREWVNIERIF